MFERKKKSPELVTSGRFELEKDGKIAYLQYSIAGGVLELIHTEVPEELRGTGLASELAVSALNFARENNLKVDIVCPSVAGFVKRHPEYTDLLMK